MAEHVDFDLSCPVPSDRHERVQLAHGGGGRLMRELIAQTFRPAFDNPILAQSTDSAVLPALTGRIAVTTDSYVVKPIFFPGGDIGKLAVCGTVNDLATAGARPYALSASFILEEGFPLADLARVLASMKRELEIVGVRVVTGDTKVVEHGRCEGVYVNTTGVGEVLPGVDLGPSRVEPGDAIIVSGDLGRHGVAILSAREGFQFDQAPPSDCAPLWSLVEAMIRAGELHCLRDLTRGGLAAALNEIALDAGRVLRIDETKVPVIEAVRGATELLGLDPLHVANEGRLVAIVPERSASTVLAAMRAHPLATDATVIGRVQATGRGEVIARTFIGTERILDLPSGEQLPRIC
ncbi:MAG: hydrogenase expression/formation protein HypE [Deltaproteobacteria bacterium]|nr:hydrogenase expression/formation protein HypE [Deltaproteobacteria bacterium]